MSLSDVRRRMVYRVAIFYISIDQHDSSSFLCCPKSVCSIWYPPFFLKVVCIIYFWSPMSTEMQNIDWQVTNHNTWTLVWRFCKHNMNKFDWKCWTLELKVVFYFVNFMSNPARFVFVRLVEWWTNFNLVMVNSKCKMNVTCCQFFF